MGVDRPHAGFGADCPREGSDRRRSGRCFRHDRVETRPRACERGNSTARIAPQSTIGSPPGGRGGGEQDHRVLALPFACTGPGDRPFGAFELVLTDGRNDNGRLAVALLVYETAR